jgi:hypothetical protein
MKTLKFRLITVALLIICTNSLMGQHTKTVNKSWKSNEIETLVVENKFGHINIVNTNTETIKMDITLEIKNLSGSKAEYLANQIRFSINLNNKTLSAKTIFNEDFKTNQEFSIVYEIQIPKNKNLDITNRYGNVTMADLNAKGNFDISYGNIQGGDLFSPENETIRLKVSYGNAGFNSINQTDAQIKYGKLSVENIETALLNTEYSIIKTGRLNKANVDSKYDHFDINNAITLYVESKFTSWNIENLEEAIAIDTQYGNLSINNVSAQFNQIDIENSYGNISVAMPYNASYYLEGECYYCNIKHHDAELEQKITENNRTYLKGKVGNNNTEAHVKVRSRYGKVNLSK